MTLGEAKARMRWLYDMTARSNGRCGNCLHWALRRASPYAKKKILEKVREIWPESAG